MKPSNFSLARFSNPNGTVSRRVSGWLADVRIRKNFKSREEAAAEMAALNAKALQHASGLRLASTFLADAQLRDAEAVFRRLADSAEAGAGSGGVTRSLGTLVDYALAHFREVGRPRPLAECITTYLAAKEADQRRDILSLRQYRSIKRELDRLVRELGVGDLTACTAPVLTAYLNRGTTSLKTHNNRRGVLSTFFKFAVLQDWLPANPVLKIPHHRIAHRRGSAVTINAEQSEALMRHVEGFEGGVLVPYFAFCLFAGIRPSVKDGEISKLQAPSINLATGVIHIEPEVSKVRMKRLVAIQPNLAAWLRAYPLDRFPIIPVNATNLRRRVFDRLGLTHDVLRHTFISMHVAKFRSMGEAALKAGNSEAIIRKHYLDLKTKEEAEAFWSILPASRASVGTTAAEIERPPPATAPAVTCDCPVEAAPIPHAA